MSGEGERAAVKREFEEAKKTARVYLRVIGALEWDESRAPGYREREIRLMRNAILKPGQGAVELPSGPAARRATELAIRYLQSGRDDKVLEALRDDMSGPASQVALEFLVYRLLATGADIPGWLEDWEPNSRTTGRRWRREAARNHRIGMVVEAMATGSNILVLYGESERTRVQLQRDLTAVADTAGKPLRELPVHDVLGMLNGMKARPWRKMNDGKGLRGADLVALTGEGLPQPLGVDAIVPDVEVRKHFPNLRPTSGEATKNMGRAYSICDAVAAVLTEELPPPSDREIERPWDRTVLRAWGEYRASRGMCDM